MIFAIGIALIMGKCKKRKQIGHKKFAIFC